MKNVVIIPSLNPNNNLIDLIIKLKRNQLNQIIVVDDGSAPEYQVYFNKIEKMSCVVLHHQKNQGKGSAIKTAVKEAEIFFNNINGYIFVDSDGQHAVSDILKINDELNLSREDIILGVRNFHNNLTPLKSRIGNTFSSIYFKLTTGITLKDTQTGLRGIPNKYKQLLLSTEGNRYEYEMNFLYNITDKKIKIKTIEIKTIYSDNNSSSHFRPLKDSLLIYHKLIKYIMSSLSSSIVDLTLFSIFFYFSNTIIISTIIARLMSGILNFTLNKKLCFKSNGKIRKEFPKYFCLFIIQMLLSSMFVKLLSFTNISVILIKIIVDTSLFIGSYIIQKRYIFIGEKYEI